MAKNGNKISKNLTGLLKIVHFRGNVLMRNTHLLKIFFFKILFNFKVLKIRADLVPAISRGLASYLLKI